MSRRGTFGRRPEAPRSGDLLGGAPVAERLQTPDVAGDRLGRERRPQLKEPGPQLGRRNRVDRARLAEPADGPNEDHPVPIDRPGRGASAALAAQNRSAAAPIPIGIGPKESSEVPDGPEVSGEQTGE